MKLSYTLQAIQVKPEFDLELFMAMCQEYKLDGNIVEQLTDLWGKWRDQLHAQFLARAGSETGHLLMWLEQEVEDEVQSIWDSSVHKGFLTHNLAQALVMAAARQLIPDLVEAGCAPLPAPEPALKKAVEEAGLSWNKQGGLSRMYAILTPFPYSGSCEVCFLRKNCPNLTEDSGGLQ